MVKTRQKTPTEIFDLDAFLKEGEAALDQFPYDTAAAHYENEEYPTDLPPSAAGTHIGMYIGWAIERDLVSDKFKEKHGDAIDNFKKRIILPSEIIRVCCGDELTKEHLNDKGNEFTKKYYRPGWRYYYYSDYADIDNNEISIHHTPNTFETFAKVKAMIDNRYEAWTKEQAVTMKAKK